MEKSMRVGESMKWNTFGSTLSRRPVLIWNPDMCDASSTPYKEGYCLYVNTRCEMMEQAVTMLKVDSKSLKNRW